MNTRLLLFDDVENTLDIDQAVSESFAPLEDFLACHLFFCAEHVIEPGQVVGTLKSRTAK